MLPKPLSARELAVSVAAFAAGAGLATVAALAVVVDRFGVVERAGPAEAIVVLGARLEPDGRPSDVLAARVAHAVELRRRGRAPMLVFSGGVGDTGFAEAAGARDYAVSLGVPQADTLVEVQSRNTAENARFTARILREHGIGRVIVTSDPYHLLRARQLFRREGLEVATSPALASPRHRSVAQRALWTLREVAALLRSPDLLVRTPVEPR